MGGLAILLIVVLYIAVVTWLAFRVKRWSRKALLLLVAFLLPTADGYLGRKYVEHLCARDGGLKVFRVVDNVDGVLGLMPDKATLERTGFRFIEYEGSFSDPGRAYRRIERLADGEIVESFDTKPRAKYEPREKIVGRRLLTVEFGYADSMVVVRETGEVLVSYRRYGGGAGWAERFLAQFADSGYAAAVTCPPYEQQMVGEALFLAALKPTKH